MSPQALREELRRQPFVPLKLILSDGKTNEIRHPEMALIGHLDLYVGTESEPGSGIAGKTDLVSMLHIVRVEQLKPPPSVKAG